MGCVQSINILNIKNLKEMTHMGNKKSTFWLDKKQRLWKIHTEEASNIITQQIENNKRIQLLKGVADFLLVADKMIRISPLYYGMRSPLAETDLFDVLHKPFDIIRVQNGLKQIARAIRFLHSRGIAHRDIKTENIIIHKGNFKLIDFDYAYESKEFHLCGTEGYICPFHPKWTCSDSKKSERMDYYAFGITIWHVFAQAAVHKMIRPIQLDRCLAGQEIFMISPWNTLALMARCCCREIPELLICR
jgi:serine/threonine protein kinase